MKSTRPARNKGQALVEFALVFPIFILLVLGFVDLARYVFINNSLAEAAREGARYAVVQDRWKDNPSGVITHTAGVATGVPAPAVTISCVNVNTGVGSTPPDSRCTQPGYVLQVKVSSSIGALALSAVIGPITISATSQVAITN